ncbi:MAG: nitroreductase family protein [Planctomycetota bacterium]
MEPGRPGRAGDPPHTEPATDVFTAILNRRSVRSYAARPIPGPALARLLQAVRAAPSACNLQPWHFVLITAPDLRRRVAAACNDQHWLAGAPLIVAGCALPQQAYQHMGGLGNSAALDVAIALDHLTLAAVAEGLGTCWIGAFDEDRVRKLLEIPARMRIVALTPVGYPAQPDLISPLDEARRKPSAAIFSHERFGGAA